MKHKIIFLFLFVITLSSCYTTNKLVGYEDVPASRTVTDYHYKYAVLEFSSYDLDMNFKYTTKEMNIFYNMNGSSGIENITLKIENLAKHSVYLDLSQSSFICNGRSTSYRSYVNDMSTNFIPPQSYYLLDVPNTFIDNNIEAIIKQMNDSGKGKIEYVESNSPIILRNILTVSDNKELNNSILLDNKFWLSSIVIIDRVELGNFTNIANKLIKNNTYTSYRTEHYTKKEPIYKKKTKVDGGLVFDVFLVLLGTAASVMAVALAAGI